MANNINPGNAQQQQDFNDAIVEYRSLLRQITDELGRQRSHVADANAEYRKLDSVAKQIQNTEEGISGLTSEQIEKLKQKYKFSISEIESQAKQLLLQKGIVNLTQTQLNYLQSRSKLSERESALLQAHLDSYELENSFIDTINSKLEERIRYEEKVRDLTGATGAIMDGLGGSMKALGMQSLATYLNIDGAKKAMQEEADAIARGEKQGGKLEVRMAGIKNLAQGLNKALFSLEAIIGFVVGQLAQGSQNMADFRKQTGMSYTSAYKLNMEMKGVAASSMDNYITSEKLNKSYAMLTEQLGVSADILGGEALVSATNLEQRLGMSAEQASKLTVFSRLQGKNTEDILASSYDVVGAFNMQNKTALNVNAVMDSVASASTATYLTMGKNVTALTEAATAAKALGLNMQQIEQISESMLNFEDSIGKELEAQLLTGGNINLAKAREYALTGDMKGLASEIGKQEGILNAFKTKNVIAQKAAADALGITREQLADMTMQQELNVLGAENFKKTYGETAYESVKARSATEKFADAIEKIKDILGSILQAFSPILDLLVDIVAIPLVPYILAAVIAAKVLGGTFKGILGTVGSIGKGVMNMVSKRGAAPIGAPSATSAAGAGGGGAGGMVQSFSKINTTSLLKGAAAMLIVAGAIFVFAKSLQEFEKIKDWTNIAIGLGAFGVSMGVIGAVGEFAAVGLEALAIGLTSFGAAMMGPGGLGLAALVVAAIGLGAALNLAAPGIEAFGKVITAVFTGLATLIPVIVDGFVNLISAIAGGIGPLLLLGPALFGIAAGLGAVGVAGLMSLPGIGALAIVSKIAPSIVSAGGKTAGAAKGKAEEGSMAAVAQKLDVLIELAKKGTVVKLDGKVLATSNAQNQKQVLSNQR
jgi:hypothetical protein